MNEVWVCQYGLKPKSPNCVVEPKDCGAYDNGVCALTGGPCDAKRFVEERVGRWEGIIKAKGKQVATCSVCKGVSTYHVTTAFCPHCGARMEV